MADLILPDPRMEMPELFEPGFQLSGEVVLNTDNPLTWGLVGCWFFNNESKTIDLTGNNHGADAGSTVVVRSHDYLGSYASVPADNSSGRISLGSIDSNNPLSLSKTGVGSIYSFATQISGGGNTFPRFIDKSSGGGAANGWGFWTQTANRQFTFWVAGSEIVRSVINVYENDVPTGFGVSFESANSSMFVNGKPISLVSDNSYTSIPTNTNNCALLNWNTGTDRNWQGPMYCTLVWDRKLSAEEHLDVHSFVKQIVIPA